MKEGILTFLAVSLLLLSGCKNEYSGNVGGASNGGDGSLPGIFNQEGKRQYDAQCASCHGVDGNGTSIGSPLVACATCTSVEVLADEITRTMPISKTEQCVDQCATDTAEYILYAFNGSNLSAAATALDGVTNEDAVLTLRKATLQLAGRLPTSTETSAVLSEGDSALSSVLDVLMNEPVFYERLMEFFNEQLLTDKYLSSNLYEGGINLLDNDDYPNRKWYETAYPGDALSSIRSCVRTITNDAVSRAPLELIRYAAMNDLPHTLYVNADYMMVNWYSQQVYDAELLDPAATFAQTTDPVCDENDVQLYYDPTDFKPARITRALEHETGGVPHAGVLTSPMFLNRYPTTLTNRNRHRSRIVFDYFMDTDILQIEGDRPGDGIGNGSANPTLLDPACYACHQVMDPVATAFQHWTDRGQYIVTGSTSSNQWDSSDIEPAGLNGKTIPLSGADGYFRNMLQWLGTQISNDPRYVRATVRTLYTGLIGSDPLQAPGEDASEDEQLAYTSQRTILNAIGQAMVADGWRIKTAVKGIILSSYYRAIAIDEAKLIVTDHIGSSQFLSPEQVQRKLNATLGFGWDEFRSEDNRIMYGGMDSDSITERITEPSGLVIAIQDRMASEMACRAAALDFTRSIDKRKLFVDVETSTDPRNDEGVILTAQVARIKSNIAHLHWVLIGEQVATDSAEVQATYDLFSAVLSEGQEMLENKDAYDPRPSTYLEWECRARWYRDKDGRTDGDLPEEDRIEEDSNYVIRAWIAVIAYLLSDYRFVYE